MSDISVSERRLSAALDRIDQFLDRGGPVHAAHGPDLREDLAAAQARIRMLTDQLGRQDMAEQAARLAAANDDLIAANRALIEEAGEEGDMVEAVSRALEAEIEALRAARAAEAAQLGALMAEVERLLADDAAASVATPEAAGDAGGVPESIQDGDTDGDQDGDTEEDR
ncbi:hypothetical protein [Paracoccus sp. S3-43]|uniref:hypothetical protein n=1 Tax=Paracoccus sp. S3-43 TaxID=3030011 RepID=UPI0023AE7CE4|nr:hypothetical protein [Paracoccus sp. S3-43]WEF23473.1 hypothetical protein PXD02_11710 [Paracoccus sp. S3-43]